MRRDPAKAVVVLDAMLEFFDGGRRWINGQLRDKDGRCLVGALGYVRRQQRIRGAGTEHYLRRAMIDRAGDLDPLTDLWVLTIGMPDDGNLMRYNSGTLAQGRAPGGPEGFRSPALPAAAGER